MLKRKVPHLLQQPKKFNSTAALISILVQPQILALILVRPAAMRAVRTFLLAIPHLKPQPVTLTFQAQAAVTAMKVKKATQSPWYKKTTGR